MIDDSCDDFKSNPNDEAEMNHAVSQAWSRETSADPAGWSEDNPAWGQCAVTALFIQEYYRGTILRAMTKFGSHYWNRLPDGRELDLTRKQFPPGTAIPPGEERSPEQILIPPKDADIETVRRYESTAGRFALLKENIARVLMNGWLPADLANKNTEPR